MDYLKSNLWVFLVFVFSFQLAAQNDVFVPLSTESEIFGIDGRLKWKNTTVESSTWDEFTYGIDLLTGKFVKNYWAVGGLFSWDETQSKGLTTNSLILFGAFTRYYLPIKHSKWYYYPEVSLGYGQIKLNDSTYIKDGGFVYTAGVGLATFLSRDVAIEVVGRYEKGNFSGDADITLKNFTIDFGLQIYFNFY